ncbi:MAG TPA: hypothetical protein ENK18_22590 [Deltaproteobacteria bacterium]|nr:hypothetical protein [Deltaproteobacteria bacterium]
METIGLCRSVIDPNPGGEGLIEPRAHPPGSPPGLTTRAHHPGSVNKPPTARVRIVARPLRWI